MLNPPKYLTTMYLLYIFRCFSIPVTLRSVIKRVQEDIRQQAAPEPVIVPVKKFCWTMTQPVRQPIKMLPETIVPTNISNSVSPSHGKSLPNPPPYPGGESWSQSHSNHNQQIEMHKYSVGFAGNRSFGESLVSQAPVMPPVSSVAPSDFHTQQPRPAANPLLSTLLDSPGPSVEPQVQNQVCDSPMLSKLLEENTSVAVNPFPTPSTQRKRLTKRKSSKDMMGGKSPKHRVSDSDISERTSERVNSERHGQGMGEKHIDLDDDPVRPSSVSSVSSLGGQSTGSLLDLPDIGESHVKKLENSLESIMDKESPHGSGMSGLNSQLSADVFDINFPFPDLHHNQSSCTPMLNDPGGDFQQPHQWSSRQTPPIPTSRNSPHHGVVPKNEKTSTSLEELLQGPRGRENDGPNSVHVRRNSQQRRQSLKRQNSTGRNSVDSSSGYVSPSLDVFSPLITSPSHNPLASPLPTSSPLSSVSPSSSLTMISPSHTSSAVSPSLQPHGKLETLNHDSKSGIFGSHVAITTVATSQTKSVMGHFTSAGKPSLSLLKAQLEMDNKVSAISQEKDCVSVIDEHSSVSSVSSNSSQPPLMKLKLTNMRQFDSVSQSDGEESKSRSSTYDFNSDDEDFTLPKVELMTVVSQSPTRLHISNKSTIASFNKFNKSEKIKRKQRELQLKEKQALSVDSGKRKRDKEEAKKDKKKKKLNSYSVDKKEVPVYKSTPVPDEGENDHIKRMPKLKITKSGGKISVENPVVQVKDLKSVDKNSKDVKSLLKDEKDKLEKEAVVKIEKVEKVNRKLDLPKDVNNVIDSKSEKKEEKSSSAEGIFDKINAMKTESFKNSEDSNSSVDRKSEKSDSCSISHKKVTKKIQKRSISTSKSDSKISKTPTIKLAPIKLPTNSSTSVTISRTPSTPSTPLTPKSVSQSPTSTTIGKIGAVSLATSGSQKQLTNPTNKSPQGLGASGKSLSSRSLSTGGSSSLNSKLNSNLQKNIQIQGPSGKNSPVPSSSKSNHSRSSSTSALNSSSGSLKQEKSLSKSLSSSTRTSSPSLEKEKSKSSSGSSRSSSSGGRDRDKSTSANKTSVPVSTVSTQDVLSFLNPKEISNFTIPKLSSSANTQKVSTPTSVNSPTIVSTCASTTVTTTTTSTSVKFSKGSTQTVTSASKSSNSGSVSTTSSKSSVNSNSSNTNMKNSSYNKGTGNLTSSGNSRPTNLAVSNTVNSNRGGTNSPNSFPQKGLNNIYNKGNHQNSGSQNSGFRNYNNASTPHSKSSNSSSSPNMYSNWNNNGQFNKASQSVNHANQNSFRGNSANFNGNSKSGNSNGNSEATNSGRQTPVGNAVNSSNFRGTNMASNGPKGPGPPNLGGAVDNKRQGSGGQVQAAVRGRKGSLSAVIDKLTCKAGGPTSGSTAASAGGKTGSQKPDQVIVNESPASPELDAPVLEPVKQENKVVIEEAPASPEPEISSPTSLQNNRLSSANEIVSIPLENKPSHLSVNSDFSKERSSPKTIPLDSPLKDKNSETKSFTSESSNKLLGSNSRTLNPISQQNGDIDYRDRSQDYSTNHNADLTVTSRAKDSVFKVPESFDKSVDDIDSKKYVSRSDSKAPSAQSSPASSPENGLIIDFSPSSLNHQNKTSVSPQRNTSSDSRTENHSSPNCRKSPSIKSSATTAKLRASPAPSPVTAGSNPGSPGYLEDDLDLMDEALGLGN